MRTAINITGELKYILVSEKNGSVVPFYTLRASELIKQDVELVNHDYSVALYGFRYETETKLGTFRYLFLVEHSMAGFRPYAVYHDLPENVKALRDTIDFSLFAVADPDKEPDASVPHQANPTEKTTDISIWKKWQRRWLPSTVADQDQRQQQRRGGRRLIIFAAIYAVLWASIKLIGVWSA